MKKITNIILHTAGLALAFVLIALAISGCNATPVGDNSIRLQSFLKVSYPDDSWGISSPPAAMVTNSGPVATEVLSFRFTLVADGDVDMDVSADCDLMYEDMVSEMVLILHCTGYWLEQHESLVMGFPLRGPWHMLELTSVFSENEDGEIVYNDISADHPMMWFNPDY